MTISMSEYSRVQNLQHDKGKKTCLHANLIVMLKLRLLQEREAVVKRIARYVWSRHEITTYLYS